MSKITLKISTPSQTLYGPSQCPLRTVLRQKSRHIKGNQHYRLCFSVSGLKTNLLGMPAITSLPLATRIDSTETGVGQQDYRNMFLNLFTGLGNFGAPYDIQLKKGSTPPCVFTSNHVPLPLREKVKAESGWAYRMVCSHGSSAKERWKIRTWIDMKPLNECVLREIHPLPKVDETLAQLSGAKTFSKLDANSGFWQITLAKTKCDYP